MSCIALPPGKRTSGSAGPSGIIQQIQAGGKMHDAHALQCGRQIGQGERARARDGQF